MDDFLQKSLDPMILFVVLPAVAILISYIVIRVAVTLSLRDHVRWLEKRREWLTRNSYPNAQAYPPISPESKDTF